MKQATKKSKSARTVLGQGARPFGVVTAIFLAALGAFAEPGRRDLLESGDPLLEQAITYDLELAPDGIGNQDMAEQHYLAFIEQNPDSPLVPYLYDRLANNFAVWLTDERLEAGNSYQRDKGQHYWEMTVQSYPKNEDGDYLLGPLLFRAMVSAACYTADSGDRIIEYAEIYKMARDLTEEDIRNRLWLSDREISANQPLEELPEPVRDFEQKYPGVLTEKDKLWLNPPDAFESYFEDSVKTFIDNVEYREDMLSEQMLSIAEHAQEPEKTELLQLIAQMLPDDEPGILARQQLNALSAAAAPPSQSPAPPPQEEPAPPAQEAAPQQPVLPEPVSVAAQPAPVQEAAAPASIAPPPKPRNLARALLILGGTGAALIILIAGRAILAKRSPR